MQVNYLKIIQPLVRIQLKQAIESKEPRPEIKAWYEQTLRESQMEFHQKFYYARESK